MRERYKGRIVRKYGLVCGPHPDRCGCCRTVRYTAFKRLQRRAKRAMGKRECSALIREESEYIDAEQFDYNAWMDASYGAYLEDIDDSDVIDNSFLLDYQHKWEPYSELTSKPYRYQWQYDDDMFDPWG